MVPAGKYRIFATGATRALLANAIHLLPIAAAAPAVGRHHVPHRFDRVGPDQPLQSSPVQPPEGGRAPAEPGAAADEPQAGSSRHRRR